MPVPAEADAKKESSSPVRTAEQQNSSNSGGILPSPASSAPVSAPSNDQAPSPGAEENGPARSNGGAGVTSPIEMANTGDQMQPQ